MELLLPRWRIKSCLTRVTNCINLLTKSCTTDTEVCFLFNPLVRNDVICKNEKQPRAHKQTYEQAVVICGENGIRVNFNDFACYRNKTFKGHYSTFWNGLKRYNGTHFTDGIDMMTISKKIQN